MYSLIKTSHRIANFKRPDFKATFLTINYKERFVGDHPAKESGRKGMHGKKSITREVGLSVIKFHVDQTPPKQA